MKHLLPSIILVSSLNLVSTPDTSAATRVQDDTRGLRMLVVETEQEALDLRARIQSGVPFEVLARDHSVDPTAPSGGYMGRVDVNSLRLEFREALSGVAPGEVSFATRIGSGFLLLQPLSQDEVAWMETTGDGIEAFGQARRIEARRLFLAALERAESFGPQDYRLAQSLTNLGTVYLSLGLDERAEPVYRRALEIRERVFGPGHAELVPALDDLARTLFGLGSNLAESGMLFERSLAIVEDLRGPAHEETARALNSLALVRLEQQNYSEALALLERSLSILEGLRGPEHADVARALENLAEAQRLQGNFRAAEEMALRSLEISERLFAPDDPLVISRLSSLARIHREQGNYPTAMSLVARALGLRWVAVADDPGRVIRVIDALAEVLDSGRFRDPAYVQVMDDFEAAIADGPFYPDFYVGVTNVLLSAELVSEAESVMLHAIEAYPDSFTLGYKLATTYATSSVLDKALDVFRNLRPPSRLERSLVLGRMGDLLASLLRHDEARQAYDEALRADPDNLEARLGLAEVLHVENRSDEALVAYDDVLARDPENVLALGMSAGVNGLLRRYEEAARRATEALELGWEDPDLRYTLAIALRSIGRPAEAQDALREYQSLLSIAQEEDERRRQIGAFRNEAAERVRAGEPEDALAVLRRAIEDHPEAELVYTDLARVESRLGDHRAAVETLEQRLALGIRGDYLVHAALAREYRALGDVEAAESHQILYLQNVGEAVEAAAR